MDARSQEPPKRRAGLLTVSPLEKGKKEAPKPAPPVNASAAASRPEEDVICEEEESGAVPEGNAEEGGDEETDARALGSPCRPSQAEIDLHNVTHLPYRSWCAFCVRGRGRGNQHRTISREEGLSRVAVDYGFLGKAHSSW